MDVLKLVLHEVVPCINIPLHNSFQKQLHGAVLLKSSSMWCHVVWQISTNGLKQPAAFIFRAYCDQNIYYCENLWHIFLEVGLVKKFPTFMGCENSLSCPHEHSTGSFLEQDESSILLRSL